MALSDLYNDHISGNIRQKGLAEVSKDVALESLFGFLRRIDASMSYVGVNRGVRVLDEDWDLLVVLDACRADLMHEVEDEFSYFEDYSTDTSLAGGSLSWMRRNFTRAEINEKVAMVSANPFTQRALSTEDFHVLDEVWKTDWSDKENTVLPSDVTDHAIHVGREYDFDRMVVHYMQPHHPFIGTNLDDGINKNNPESPAKTVWSKLADDELSYETVWNGYQENLRLVLNELYRLFRNIDAVNTVVTADHGNSLGSYGFYGHGDVPIRVVRDIPWNTVKAEDKHQCEPNVELSGKYDSSSLNERLEHLGYS